ncbi:MAG: 3-dehydroquinate synthase [Verrucomicrobiota bacterium]
MPVVPVSLPHAPYEVKIAPGLLASTGTEARALFPACRSCALVTDSKVGPLYAETVAKSLRDNGIEPVMITVPAGEPSKCFSEIESINRQMIRAGLGRQAFLVALGGGVIGDLAGFAASIFFRGIPCIQIPTTVVSLVDSSVGGKTGINTPEGKNLIGTFHQPRLVLADPGVLHSLPEREFNEGFAEIIKHAAIRDAAMLPEITAAATAPRESLSALIARNVAIKAAIVTEDEFETKGLRALLNFGHTIGHAIEASAGYGGLFHGEAISLGIRAALFLSERHAGLAAAESAQILDLLRLFKLPLVLPDTIADSTILEKMGRDKKFDQGAIRFVLLSKLGEAHVSKNISGADITDAIALLRRPVL